MDRVLGVCETSPVAAVDDEHCHGKRYRAPSVKCCLRCKVARTVAEKELGNAGEVHCDAPEEVVIAAKANETLGRNRALETAKDQDSRGVWDEKPYQAEQCWITWQENQHFAILAVKLSCHTKSFCKVTAARCRWLEEETLVLLRA